MKWYVAIATLSSLFTLYSRPAFADVIWHHPPDRVVIDGGGGLHAVLELQNKPDRKVIVRLNGIPLSPVKSAVPERTGAFVHYQMQLEEGLNTLEATWDGGSAKREVFLVSSWGEARVVPPGFSPLVFHKAEEGEQACRSCHDFQPKLLDAGPPSPEKSTCYTCHFRITAFKQVHGPASRWACTFCHDPNSTPSRYATPKPNVSKLCFRCHSNLKEYFDRGPYQHGPTATGRCTICHNPHASDNPFWLKRAPWYLCTSCHSEKASGRHVIAWGPTGDTHPTRGRPDPMRPEMELACNSCHNPHAAPSPKLWKFNVTSRFRLCQTCHNK